MRMIFSSAKKN